MQFSLAKTAVAAFGFSNVVFGAATPAQIINNLKTLTAKSQALQEPAQSITIVNGPLIAVGQGPLPKIISGFSDIVTTATADISQMDGTTAVTNTADANAIYDAYNEFVSVHQVLLNILIGKAGLLSVVPLVGQPVTAVLRADESVIDTISFSLVDLVQSRAADLQNQANSLSSTLETAINAYEGITNQNNFGRRSVLKTRSASFRAFRV